MSDKTAIVTGGGRGIGLAIARRLTGDGWRVVLAEQDPALGRTAAESLGGEERARFVETDVADEEAVRRMVEHTVEAFGRVHGLVNNAGIMVERPVETLALDDWRRVLDVNLTAAFLTTKHTAGALRQAGGAIVNIASTRAHMSEPNTEAYAASKGGLVALTRALAVSLGPAIRVNVISPGWIETGDPTRLSEDDHAQHPAGRVGRPADVADLAAYLLSPSAGFITGAEFVVDGGMTRKMIYV